MGFRNVAKDKGATQQFNGREGETATFLSRCLLSLSLRVAVSPHVNSIVGRFVVRTNGSQIRMENLF